MKIRKSSVCISSMVHFCKPSWPQIHETVNLTLAIGIQRFVTGNPKHTPFKLPGCSGLDSCGARVLTLPHMSTYGPILDCVPLYNLTGTVIGFKRGFRTFRWLRSRYLSN